MTRSEIMATLNEINNLSLLPGAIIKIVKCGSTAKFNLVVKIDNKMYYKDIWLSNYNLFDDIFKELNSCLELNNIKPSIRMVKLIEKIKDNPFYMDWNKFNGVYQLSL